jgi:threonine 3-dehydrogenase
VQLSGIERRGLTDRVTIVDGKNDNATEIILDLTHGGCDVGVDFSGAEGGINTTISSVRAGGEVSLLGIPRDANVVIKNYGTNVIMKGLTIYGIIGREMFSTWDKMIQFIDSGLDVSHFITGEYALSEFEKGLKNFSEGNEQKVVLYPDR